MSGKKHDTHINRCPVCNADGFEDDVEEVDIGVGIQEFLCGGYCHGACDRYVKCCPLCGSWGGEHAEWCVTRTEKEVSL